MLLRTRRIAGGMISVASRVHCCLRKMKRFQQSVDGTLPALPSAPPLDRGEHLLGIYRDDEAAPILVTDHGLHWRDADGWVAVPYSDIGRVVGPDTKQDVNGLHLLLRNGTQLWLPVTGCTDGRFYDAFEMWRFINRVIGDRQKSS